MTKAKSWMNGSSSAQRADLFSIPGVMRASEMQPPLSPAQPAEEWKEFILFAFRKHLSAEQIEDGPSQTEYAAKELYQLLLKKAPADREWAQLFRLYAAFYSFFALAELMDEVKLPPETAERAAYDVLFYFADEAYDAAKMTGSSSFLAFEPYISRLRTDTGRLLGFPFEQFPAARVDVYRLLWEALFTKKEWRQEELSRLSGPGENNLAAHTAKLHQLYLLDETEEFARTAAAGPAEVFPYFLHWLQDSKRSGRFLLVLKPAAALARDGIALIENEYSRRMFVRQVIRLVDDSGMHDRAPALVKDLYTALLPFSYASLSYFLSGRGEWADWVDLQILLDADITDLDRAGLKSVIKEAPVLSLPLLHRGISTFVAERNRSSYKKAVRYIKRLRTVYKKLKRMPEFEQWLDWLLGETKRLRAFQEECKKGGLLDD